MSPRPTSKWIDLFWQWWNSTRLSRDGSGSHYYDIGLGLRLYPWAQGGPDTLSKERMGDLIHPACKDLFGIVRENICVDNPRDWLERAVVRRLRSRYGEILDQEWREACPGGRLHPCP